MGTEARHSRSQKRKNVLGKLMKILFSSDLHGLEYAYQRFAFHLKNYDLGVLAGDMQEDFLPDEEIERLTHKTPDHSYVYTSRGDWKNSEEFKLLTQAMNARSSELLSILEEPQKPIFIVLGNHDIASWEDSTFIKNIHMKNVQFDGYNFVGYRWTNIDRSIENVNSDIDKIIPWVNEKTILVTHSPPYGVLDGEPRFGSKALRRLPTPWMHLFGHIHEDYGCIDNKINGAWPNMGKFFEVDVEKRSARLIDPQMS